MTPQNATAAPATWQTGEPPKDGATYAAMGNIIASEEDGCLTTAYPFTEFVHWDASAIEWLGCGQMTVRRAADDELHFHHHISLPTP